MESEPQPRLPEPLDDLTPRNEVLRVMMDDGWANASTGDVASPTGRFGRITNTPAELPEVVLAFEDDLQRLGLERAEELLGHFLVIDRGAGPADVVQYGSSRQLIRDYEQLKLAYALWRARQ